MSTAKDQMTKLLDQLMGQNRDGTQKGREKHFTDRDVCRPFLLGICINELFVNTREEMSECSKVHSLVLKGQFEKANQKKDYRFEEEVLEYLRSFIQDNEKKIELNKKRIENVEEDAEQEKLVSIWLPR
jgi:RNA-binding protein Luc7-like 2